MGDDEVGELLEGQLSCCVSCAHLDSNESDEFAKYIPNGHAKHWIDLGAQGGHGHGHNARKVRLGLFDDRGEIAVQFAAALKVGDELAKLCLSHFKPGSQFAYHRLGFGRDRVQERAQLETRNGRAFASR
jgi:hypothetical protein